MGDDRHIDHYFSADPRTPVRATDVVFTAAGRTFRLRGGAGVFSAGRLDPGTAVLLRKAELPRDDTRGALLDLGCGYGPIACVLATVAPLATVYAVDVNARARELARANAVELGLTERMIVADPADLPKDVEFVNIWSNPPIRVGKGELRGILVRWLARLAPGGVAWLVVARHLGADSLATWLGGLGLGVTRQASQRGFRVLRVTPAEYWHSQNSADPGAGTVHNS